MRWIKKPAVETKSCSVKAAEAGKKGRRVQKITQCKAGMRVNEAEVQDLISQLLETMRVELHQNQRLLRTVRQRKDAVLAQAAVDVEALLNVEREMVTNVVTVERDRISILTALGQVLGHPEPSRLRVAEIILHTGPENRDELLDLREEFRDVADELDVLSSVEPLFSRHSKEKVRLYVTPSRSRAVLGESRAPIPRQAESTPALPGVDEG